MNLRKLIVYKYDVLFDILDEIKEKLNFEIIKVDSKNIKNLKNELKENFLLISKEPQVDFENSILINDTPVKIEKIIEKINLCFLKNKFSAQSEIKVGVYKLNLNSREISKNNIVMSLTEREINLICFLKNSEKAVSIDELQKKVWDYGSELETHTVETHIYRLRKKIKEQFKDENFIVSSKEGYLVK